MSPPFSLSNIRNADLGTAKPYNRTKFLFLKVMATVTALEWVLARLAADLGAGEFGGAYPRQSQLSSKRQPVARPHREARSNNSVT